jgi:4-hydroxybenzoate polyprenyltransferase
MNSEEVTLLSHAIATPPNLSAATLRPLCVDLDGTLVKSDTLVDSLLVLARNQPAQLLKLPGQLRHGKAAFKAFVTSAVSLDVIHLPYNRALLPYLQEQARLGRAIYLATGADQRLAHRVAEHLGIFSGVLASDGTTNLIGKNKLERLRAQLGSDEFDYIGNDTPDLPLLKQAPEPMVANPSLRLRLALRATGLHPTQTFIEHRGFLRTILKAMRLHQWAKNLLIFAPLLLAHSLLPAKILTAVAAFLCYSLTASSAYLINDLLDIEADRRHPRKRRRPIASGDLPGILGALLAVALLVVAFAGARWLPFDFQKWLLVYLVTTLSYSSILKRFALVDVLVLSGLYILRIVAGAAASGVLISHWLSGFSMFLFLSLAIVKRFAELENLRAANAAPKNGRGYLLADQEQLRAFGTSSAYAAVVVYAIYINSTDVIKLYHKPNLLWLTVPLMLLWLNRVWLLASRGRLDEDPVAFAITDRASLLIGLCVAAVVLLSL